MEDNGGVKGHRGAVAYCVRADARRSWRAWLVLGLLVGVAAGGVAAAAAGARRTDSAFRELRTETDAMDAGIGFTCDPEDPACPTTAEEVRAYPGVVDAASFITTKSPVFDAEGNLIQINGDTCGSGAGAVDLITPLDPGFGTDVNRVRILEGRAADPSRADEVVMAPIAAESFGVEVGDRLFAFGGPELDCLDRATWGRGIHLTVVGIGMSAAEIPPKAGFYLQGIHTTPAFVHDPAFAELLSSGADDGDGETEGPVMAVRLDEDVTLAELADTPGVAPFEVAFDLRDDISRPIDEGLRADANALWIVSALTALASLFLVFPALDRHAAAMVGVDDTLTSLGWSRSDRVVRAAAHGAVVAVIGLVTMVTVVVVASSRTPIGDARTIDPDPGIEIDPRPFLLGAVVLILVSTVGLGLLVLRRTTARSAVRRTPLAGTAARIGASATAVLGIRIGLEPGRRQAPVRSSMLAVAVGAAAIVGSLVYTNGAQHLRETPALAGLNWDDFLYVGDRDDGADIAVRAAAWPEVEATGHLYFFTDLLLLGEEHEVTHVLAFSTGAGAVEPTVIRGRAPSGPSEILLTPDLADRLGLRLGETVAGTMQGFDEETGESIDRGARDLEMVGIGPLPLGDGNFQNASAMTTEGYLAYQDPEVLPQFEGRADFVTIRREPGIDDAAIVARARTVGVEFDPAFVSDAALETLISIDVTSTESAPDLLAFLMAVMTGSILAYALATAVSRDRLDLAVVRAMGFRPRQVRRSAVWAATAFTGLSLAIAVPVGIVVGRVAWRAYAESLGIVPTPFVPWDELAVLVGLSLVFAVLVDLVAAWRQNRLRPAEVLRTE